MGASEKDICHALPIASTCDPSRDGSGIDEPGHDRPKVVATQCLASLRSRRPARQFHRRRHGPADFPERPVAARHRARVHAQHPALRAPAVTKAFDRIEYALEEIRQGPAPTVRTLRVQFPASFAVQLAAPLLRDFRRLSPEVEINLVSPYAVGPPSSDVDIAVVYSRPTITERVSDLLWPVRMGLVCHPDVAARHAGQDLGAFIGANELIHMRIDNMPRHHFWIQFKRQANLGAVNVERGLVFDTELLAVQYALSGEGLALVDLNLFRAHLEQGRLVAPFDTTLDDGFGYYLVTDSEALGDPAIALFRSWLIERFAPAHHPTSGAVLA